METSLRYGRDSKALRIHAKEKFPLNSRTLLQVHGELDTRDTRMGGPSFVSAMIRFNPDLSTSLGAGVQYDKHEMLTYGIRAKKTFPVTRNVTGDNSLNFNIKGWCKIDKEFKEKKSKGAAEFVWSIFNFRKDQDIRLKIGYEVTDKVPYLQIRENNWTLNADMDGRWNVRFDL